jgi:LPXTG-motif cell wall-anchored protein
VQNLRDIVVPEAISYIPQTTAWYVVFGVFLVLLAGGGVFLVRRERRNRYRKLALHQLADIEARGALCELPALVKQTALSFASRDEVASLSGDDWLRFLDETYHGDAFTHGPGRQLPVLAYGRPNTDEVDELVTLVRQWIRKHHVRV